MAWTSSSEKPLAMRSITVAARLPERNSCIAATISFGSRPATGGTGEPSRAGAWQPEQAAAPGGGGVCAPAGTARPARRAATSADFALMDRSSGEARRRGAPPSPSSGLAEVVVLQRQRADALARRREERVQHRRRRDRDGRLADAAPEAAR